MRKSARTTTGRGPDRGPDRRGATLLVSIAILTLLAVFSIAFVQLVNF
jgi:Tfp pilus assembly protein PilX